MTTRTKKVNLTITETYPDEARTLGVNMSRVADEAIGAALKAEREQRWKEEHAEAFRLYNERIERDGIPLSEFRKF